MSKTNKIIYWISSLWIAAGMLSSGVLQLLKVQGTGTVSPPGVFGMTHLGYPIYFLTILGIWKILGVVAMLIPKFPLLKEWAYAGFFFAMSGAIYSHVAVGDPAKELFPASLLLVMIVISWYLRPADRKLVSVNEHSHAREDTSPNSATAPHGNHAPVGA